MTWERTNNFAASTEDGKTRFDAFHDWLDNEALCLIENEQGVMIVCHMDDVQAVEAALRLGDGIGPEISVERLPDGRRPAAGTEDHAGTGAGGVRGREQHLMGVYTHTPGPWQAIQVPGNSRLTVHGEVYDVATTCHAGSSDAEQANARLIAAAPTLLKHLLQLVDTFDPDKQVIYEFARPQIEQARAVVKEVRG